MTGVERFDVFVVYAEPDRPWVVTLSGRLRDAGFRVFFDEWEVLPGDVVTRRQEQGIQAARAGVVVCSPAAVSSPQVMDQYAALYSQTVEKGRRLIPVLHEDVGMPPFLDIRRCVDFRHAEGDVYQTRVAQLIAALGEAQPTLEVVSALPPGGRVRPEGARRARLTVAMSGVEVVDRDEGRRTTGIPRAEVARRIPARLQDVHRIGHRRDGDLVRRGSDAATADQLSPALREAGVMLGEAFIPDPVGAALTGLIGDARRHGAGLRLAVCAGDDLVDWPWEALIPPGADRALALTESVEVFRGVDVEDTVPGVVIPGPLRILVVLASPEGEDGGPLLDVEHELATVLDAVDPARKRTAAHVQVLNLGTLAALRDALKAQRFHVLHVCCHARPGRLLLEDERGLPHEVTAQELVAAIPENRRPAAVVLAGCSTALSVQAAPQDSADALPGLARQLLAAGVPQVVAMTAAVTDRYAALFAAALYRELAVAAEPMVVDAVAHARRQIEADRRALPQDAPVRRLVEWATPVVFARGEPQPLYDPAAPPGPVTEAPEPVLPAGVPLRPVGDFVGRRAELRTLVAALRHRARAGAVIHGIGGVGKSSLAAELLRLLGQDIGIVVPVVGATGADAILAAFGQALFTRAIAEGLPERHPWRQLSGYLRMPGEPWQERLTAAFQVLAQQPVTLLIDNFETNLDEQTSGPALIRDDILAEFLAAWAVHQGPHRLLVTSRYPFELPGNARRRLVHHHLGPLSLAETRKLIWRLPGLDALTPEQQRRACTDVGGHPRTLEYLDALLRKGQARFDDVTDRLEQLLADRGITAPDRWLDDLHTARDGDDTEQNHLVGRALAEAVTLTVNDSLLDRLLGLLDPAARTLLIGAAVYRQPIDQLGLAWQIHPPAPNPTDPERDQRLTELTHKLDEANTAGQPVDDWTQLGYTTEQVTQLRTDITEMGRPPLSDTTVDAVSLATLDTLGLLVPIVRPDDNRPQYVLHRWTAAALARLHPDATTSAHHRAAAYYTWRVQHQAQDKLAELYDQIEARYHHYAAANLTAAVSLSYEIRDQLHTWAAWDWETSICHETLTWLPPNTYDTAAFTHQLGILAQARGDYAEAERRYQQSLTIGEELGDRAGMASSYHQLGNLAYLQGDYAEAERRYQQSLTVNQELGNRAGMAGSYHQLGILAYLQGDYAEAERRYQQSLTVNQELGNRAGMAGSYHQLGILAYLQGDYAEAERRYQQSLTIGEQLGNRAGMATSYGQLGILAQDRGDYAEAERRYQQSLTIDEELGNRAGMATSYHQLGMIAQDRGDYAEAERRYQQSLTIGEQLGNRAGMAGSYHQLGILAYLQGDYAEAERRYQQSLTINQELGNRAGMAISISQLGTLRTETGDFAEAVTLHCQALVIRLGIGLPQAGFDIARLRDLRAKLCEHRFSDAVTAILDEQSSQALTALLDQTERPEQEDGT